MKDKIIVFKCDSNIYCGKCYLDILNDAEFKNLVITFTRPIEINKDVKCDNCQNLVCSKESLNAYLEIDKILRGLEK